MREMYTLSLHDALPICRRSDVEGPAAQAGGTESAAVGVLSVQVDRPDLSQLRVEFHQLVRRVDKIGVVPSMRRKESVDKAVVSRQSLAVSRVARGGLVLKEVGIEVVRPGSSDLSSSCRESPVPRR